MFNTDVKREASIVPYQTVREQVALTTVERSAGLGGYLFWSSSLPGNLAEIHILVENSKLAEGLQVTSMIRRTLNR
jgi:hypothetical protein